MRIILIGILLVCFGGISAQDSTRVVVLGRVIDDHGESVPHAMVVNLRFYTGSFAAGDGSFEIEINKNDTLSIGSLGMTSQKISYADSVYKPVYKANVVLKDLRIKVGTADVFAPRELEDIYSDIDRLGFDKNDYMVSNVDALASPITFLYQQFSKRERSKREVAEMENNDMRRELLKELLSRYAAYDIIALEDSEFDRFIDYLRVSDEMLQNTSQYEFILYVKDRYNYFVRNKRKLQDYDYDYHKD